MKIFGKVVCKRYFYEMYRKYLVRLSVKDATNLC